MRMTEKYASHLHEKHQSGELFFMDRGWGWGYLEMQRIKLLFRDYIKTTQPGINHRILAFILTGKKIRRLAIIQAKMQNIKQDQRHVCKHTCQSSQNKKKDSEL